jgi:hypothetical protein
MSKANIEELVIDGQTYVPKSSYQKAEKLDGMEYVIVRGDRSGVFAGYLESKKEREVILRQARRIWYWSGASSISQLAEDGTSDPDNCKFPKALNKIQILDVIEIIDCTKVAKESIESVAIWKQ